MSERDEAAISDHVEAEVKGPGPEWEDRPEGSSSEGTVARNTPAGLEIGEIRNEGEEDEVKGPGEQWETDEEGDYVNRD